MTVLSPLSTSLHLHLSSFSHTCFSFPSNSSSHVIASFHTHLFALPPHVSQVDWPLNIIITDSCMNKYNRLFSFLLQLKHMVWSLREVWFHLKRTGERVAAFDRSRAQLARTSEGDQIRLMLCFTLYKIFSARDAAAVPLCFIYAKHVSHQWDEWSRSVNVRLQKWIILGRKDRKLVL